MRSIVPVLLFFLILAAACSKKETPVYVQCHPLMPSPHKITEETRYTGIDTVFAYRNQFFYDASGRLTLELTTQDGHTDTSAWYEYQSGKIKTRGADIILNDQGLAVSSNAGIIFTWTYSPEGYMTKQVYEYQGGTMTDTYTYVCYNQSRIVRLTQTSISSKYDTTGNIYYTDKANTIGNENHGIYFDGKQSNALIKTITRTNQPSLNLTYVFDGMNRVQWETTRDSLGHVSYRKFTYLP